MKETGCTGDKETEDTSGDTAPLPGLAALGNQTNDLSRVKLFDAGTAQQTSDQLIDPYAPHRSPVLGTC